MPDSHCLYSHCAMFINGTSSSQRSHMQCCRHAKASACADPSILQEILNLKASMINCTCETARLPLPLRQSDQRAQSCALEAQTIEACHQIAGYFNIMSLKPNAASLEDNTAGLWVRKLDLKRGKLVQIDVGERICWAEPHNQAYKSESFIINNHFGQSCFAVILAVCEHVERRTLVSESRISRCSRGPYLASLKSKQATPSYILHNFSLHLLCYSHVTCFGDTAFQSTVRLKSAP